MKTYTQDSSISEWKRKRLTKRMDKLLSMIRTSRATYKQHQELGDLYSLLHDAQQAEASYIAAIDLLRQLPSEEQDRKQTIMLYGKILELNPSNHAAYVHLAEEYFAAGQKEKASRFLLSSAKKASEDGDHELALQCYNQVIGMGKSNPHLIERCTEVYLKLGRKQEAVDNYLHIGSIYAQEEKHVEALDYYKKASALVPEDPDILLKIARMYYALEWTENAATELVKLAEYHEKRQHFTEALKYYQNSLRLDPENEKAQAGAQRVTQTHIIDSPWGKAQALDVNQESDVLDELDQIEETFPEHTSHTDEELPEIPQLNSDADHPQQESAPLQDESASEEHQAPEICLDECLLDLETEKNFVLEEGLEAQQESEPTDSSPEAGEPEDASVQEVNTEIEPLPANSFSNTPDEFTDDDAAEQFVHQVVQMTEEPLADQESVQEEQSSPEGQASSQHEKLETLEQHLQKAEKEKVVLEQRLERITRAYGTAREHSGSFDDARYQAIISKIQSKKSSLQHHLTTLLKQREENGRFLAEELQNLHSTKQRLETNLTYIQQVKVRLEEKFETELQQAQQEAVTLKAETDTLQEQLRAQQTVEEGLQEQLAQVHREKESLQDQYTETINALTGENEQLDHQLHDLADTAAHKENALKAQLQKIHRSYRQLKTAHQASIESKEEELTRTAQQLSEFAEKYLTLEHTLGDIQKERDTLNEMLAEETATREMLEEKLVGIEAEVDSLELQGTELLEQLGQELDRQFTLKQSASDEFQVSMDEFEQLLLRQEEEIKRLEAI